MRAYLDNASITKVDPRILQEMPSYFSEIYANASCIDDFGKYSKQAIELSRKQVLEVIVIKN